MATKLERGSKALVAGPLKKNFYFFAASLSRNTAGMLMTWLTHINTRGSAGCRKTKVLFLPTVCPRTSDPFYTVSYYMKNKTKIYI